jgi:hypothetical protein
MLGSLADVTTVARDVLHGFGGLFQEGHVRIAVRRSTI